MSNVQLENVVKRYGSTQVLHGIDMEIPQGKLTVLLGPSGCGKSTLLRMIAGLEDITDGYLRIGGQVVNDLDPSKRGCAMVFQNYALYPHQTVAKNIGFPLKMAGTPKAEIAVRVQEIASLLEVDELLDRLPRDLSGGQRQRVAMGRAMIRNPDVFLFDEPLSNLDAELRVKMRLEISRLQKELSATMIFVTHDQIEAMTLADQIVVLQGGHVQQVGAPLDIYNHPANRFVAGFIGSPSMNFLSIEGLERRNGATRIRLGSGVEFTIDMLVDQAATYLGVRPEHIRLGEPAISFEQDEFSSLGTEHQGDRAYHHLRLPCGNLTVLLPEDRQLPKDGPLTFEFDPRRLHFFKDDGLILNLATA